MVWQEMQKNRKLGQAKGEIGTSISDDRTSARPSTEIYHTDPCCYIAQGMGQEQHTFLPSSHSRFTDSRIIEEST